MRSISCTVPIFFVNGNKMFYIFASFKQIWRKKYTGFAEVTVESDQGSKKKKPKLATG